MDWLTNWDDLTHGTAVFGVAIPCGVAFALAWWVPLRWWWLIVPVAMAATVWWLFGIPGIPPRASDDVATGALLAAGVALGVRGIGVRAPRLTAVLLWLILFGALAWSLYPAWLAMEGGLGRKALVTGGIAFSVTLVSLVVEVAGSRAPGRAWSLTPIAFVPPTVALAVLLQTGGSMRYGQVAIAVASCLGALALVGLFRLRGSAPEHGVPRRRGREEAGMGEIAVLWAMLAVMLGWSGWLFAEIRYGLAALLLAAPVLALLVSLVPVLPRRNLFLVMLWEFLAATAVALPVAWVAASQYAAEMSEFEGY